MSKEYTVWGIPPSKSMEDLLYSTNPVKGEWGKPITDRTVAETLAERAKQLGATRVRVATLDMAEDGMTMDDHPNLGPSLGDLTDAGSTCVDIRYSGGHPWVAGA